MSDLLTVGQAATLAGVSVRTMRRRVATGEVMTSGHGQARRIVAASVVAASLSGDSARGGQGNDTPATGAPAMTEANADVTEDMAEVNAASGAAMVGLVAVVDRLTLENRELSRQLVDIAQAAAMWQERAGMLSDRLALSERTLAALQAHHATPDEPGSMRGPEATITPSAWWRRWRVWLAAGAVLVVVGSASCQSASTPLQSVSMPLVEGPNICAAARQHIRAVNEQVADGREADPEGFWLPGGEHSVWGELATVAGFIKAYC